MALERLVVDAAECAESSVWSLSDTEVISCLDQVHQAEQELRAAKLHLIWQLESRDIASTRHATSTANWLRRHLRISRSEAGRLVCQAHALERHPTLDRALTIGEVNAEQADAITGALDALPADIGADLASEAETVLIRWAAELDPIQLRRAGARILAHVAPEVAELAEEAALRRAERAAYRHRYLTLTPVGDGTVFLRGRLDAEAAAIVTAALDPLCAPGGYRLRWRGDADPPDTATPDTATPDTATPDTATPQTAVGGTADNATVGDTWLGNTAGRSTADGSTAGHNTTGHNTANGSTADGSTVVDERSPGQRRADALTEVCRLALHTGALPANGGDRPQIVVTVAYDVVAKKLGDARLDTGERLSPSQVRRLACDAHLLPAVLGGEGQVLDVGRARRLATGPLRRAVVLRDRGCAFPACDRPARWCDVHHLRSWLDGGRTDLDNLVLLCGYHHRLIHQDDWQIRLGADRLPEFTPPTYVDQQQRPRRNMYHRRT